MDRSGDELDAEGSVPFDRDFLEVVRTVHPELESRDEVLDAAYRMTAVAELTRAVEDEATDPPSEHPLPPAEVGPGRAQALPPGVLTELGRMLVEGWRTGLVRFLSNLVEAADAPESDAVRLLGELREWDDDPANRERPPEMGFAFFFAKLRAVARDGFKDRWDERERSE